MLFRDRHEAGRILADALSSQIDALRRVEKVVVLGLARGGVPVAAQVSARLKVPLDVIVIRKISHPQNDEFAIGAIGPKGFHTWDPVATYISPVYLGHAVRQQQVELERREHVYRAGRPPLEDIVRDAHVVVVDDGIATGSTARLAVQILRHMNVLDITVAVPVAPSDSVGALRQLADRVIVLYQPSDFKAVGAFYRHFPQVSDKEVMQALE